jgi:hypothetical protein
MDEDRDQGIGVDTGEFYGYAVGGPGAGAAADIHSSSRSPVQGLLDTIRSYALAMPQDDADAMGLII